MIGICLNISAGRYTLLGMFRLRTSQASTAAAAAAAATDGSSSGEEENFETENILLNIAEDGITGESSRTGKNIYNDDDIIRVDDGRYIFNPYNTENVEIGLADVESILARYGVPSQVHNFELYRRAFVHRSYTKRPKALNDLNTISTAVFLKRMKGS